jgi:hypothetical protein
VAFLFLELFSAVSPVLMATHASIKKEKAKKVFGLLEILVEN